VYCKLFFRKDGSEAFGFEVENVKCVKHKFIGDGRCSEIMNAFRPAMLYGFVSSSHEKIES
jgi:hypothetical protein